MQACKKRISASHNPAEIPKIGERRESKRGDEVWRLRDADRRFIVDEATAINCINQLMRIIRVRRTERRGYVLRIGRRFPDKVDWRRIG